MTKASFSQKIFYKFYNMVLGVHPRNTIFAFNFSNVRHIISFFEKQVLKNIKNNDNVILDIGAGHCPYYFLFADKATRYLAIDTNFNAISDSRPIERLIATADNLPFDNCTADIVICNQLLEHVKNPFTVTREIYRTLKPGGFFLGSAPQSSPIHLEPNDYWRFTEFGIKKLLEDAGFIDISVEGNGGVHQCAVLLLCMDWMLSQQKEGREQIFYVKRALFLSPLIAVMNITAMALDKLVGNKYRTPANVCWIAQKSS